MKSDDLDLVLADILKIGEEIAVVMESAARVSNEVKQLQETTFKAGMDIARASVQYGGGMEGLVFAGAVALVGAAATPVLGKINQWKFDREMKVIRKRRVEIAKEKRAMLLHVEPMATRALERLQKLVVLHASRPAFAEDSARETLVQRGLTRSFDGGIAAAVSVRTIAYLLSEFDAWTEGQEHGQHPAPSAPAIAEDCIAWLWDTSAFEVPKSPWEVPHALTHGALLAISMGPRPAYFHAQRPAYGRAERLLLSGYVQSRALPIGEKRRTFRAFWNSCVPPGDVASRALTRYRWTMFAIVAVAVAGALVGFHEPLERYVAVSTTGVRLPPEEHFATPCEALMRGPQTCPQLVLEEDFVAWRDGVATSCYTSHCEGLSGAVESQSLVGIRAALEEFAAPQLSRAVRPPECVAVHERWSAALVVADQLPAQASQTPEAAMQAWPLIEGLDVLLADEAAVVVDAERRAETAALCSQRALQVGMDAYHEREWLAARGHLVRAVSCSEAAPEESRLRRQELVRATRHRDHLDRRIVTTWIGAS